MTSPSFPVVRQDEWLWRELQCSKTLHITARIRDLAPGDFRGLDSLTHLTIGPELDEMPVAGEIPLEDCQPPFPPLVLPPFLFSELKNLRELRILMKGITAVSPEAFYGLGNLRVLDLSGNKLKAVKRGAFEGLVSLESLAIDHNRLEDWPRDCLGGLDGLHTLNLEGNRLAGIPAGAFAGLPNLLSLNLGRNRIPAIDPTTFRGLDRLHHLNLAGNPLHFDEQTWRELSPSVQITLDIARKTVSAPPPELTRRRQPG
jgi:hypothetical protein